MSRSLELKVDEWPTFMWGMLVMLIICFWWNKLFPEKYQHNTRSLSCSAACPQTKGVMTPMFTEGKLKSIPIKPQIIETCEQRKELDDSIQCEISDVKETSTESPKEPQGSFDEKNSRGDDVTYDWQSRDDIVTDEGDENVPLDGIVSTTERSAEIESTVVIDDEGESADDTSPSDTGLLQIRIKRM